MRERLRRLCVLLGTIALAFLVGCGHRAARPAAAVRTGIVFEPAPAELGGGEYGVDCGQPLVSSAGLYMIGGQRASEMKASALPSQRVTLRGPSSFSKELDGVVWLVGAAHPLRPELVLLGGHVRPFPELGPGAPEVGVFALKLNARGEVIWRRSIADSDPDAARLEAESMALDADGRLLLLNFFGSPSIAALLGVAGSLASEVHSLAQIELPGRHTLLFRASKGDQSLDFAASDGRAVYFLRAQSDRKLLSRLDSAGNVIWQREVSPRAEFVAEGHAGGIWVVATRIYRSSSSSIDRALHYDRNGQLRGEFSIRDDARIRVIRQVVVDGRGQLWVLGRFTDSLALGHFRLHTQNSYGQWFLALLDSALEPRSVLALERETQVELRRYGDHVLVVHEDADFRCSVHSLGGPE